MVIEHNMICKMWRLVIDLGLKAEKEIGNVVLREDRKSF